MKFWYTFCILVTEKQIVLQNNSPISPRVRRVLVTPPSQVTPSSRQGMSLVSPRSSTILAVSLHSPPIPIPTHINRPNSFRNQGSQHTECSSQVFFFFFKLLFYKWKLLVCLWIFNGILQNITVSSTFIKYQFSWISLLIDEQNQMVIEVQLLMTNCIDRIIFHQVSKFSGNTKCELKETCGR